MDTIGDTRDLEDLDRTELRLMAGLPREERSRLAQSRELRGMSDDEVWEVARELYWRAEQFDSRTRMIVNDELRHRRLPEVPVSTGGDLDYGGLN